MGIREPESKFQKSHYSHPDNYEENLLRDCKERLPDIRRGNDKARHDLLVDLIALANSARRLGRPARLLFGINDQGDVVGITASLDVYCEPGKPRSKGREAFKHLLHQLVNAFIGPRSPIWEMLPGKYQGKEVVYLLIHPDTPQEPYHELP